MLKSCKACEGKGYVTIDAFGGLTVSCGACRGRGGFDVPDNKELCPECNGKGKVDVPTDLGIYVETNCKRCYSTGFIDKT